MLNIFDYYFYYFAQNDNDFFLFIDKTTNLKKACEMRLAGGCKPNTTVRTLFKSLKKNSK